MGSLILIKVILIFMSICYIYVSVKGIKLAGKMLFMYSKRGIFFQKVVFFGQIGFSVYIIIVALSL